MPSPRRPGASAEAQVAQQRANVQTNTTNLGYGTIYAPVNGVVLSRQVEPLARLLEARTQLANLVTYMDGKSGAENLIAKALSDPALLKALAAAPKAPADDVQS